ncbi:hypothetical protein [Deinococcus arcticus]|uniref:Uncharacterized protein n=1 Tax=Deinococcus arcticus TaxID=2136176 RepID=A0A2T3W4Q0_9DEIO|nr:hypothetical protein [Deinococcus arcticus]PTA66852.1 hypothetical protein C8263_15450 [Deinococcus arcticus]
MAETRTTQTLGLSGAWQGEATDPQRTFRGEVATSNLEALPVGTAVEVTFHTSARRVSGPGEHGSYLLSAGEHTWTVARFTQHPSATGHSRDDRVPSGDWVAELVSS